MEWAALLIIVYLLILRGLYIFSYNTDLEGVEFCSVHFLQLLKLRHYLYSDAAAYPYLLIVYAPLYYYVMLPLLNILSLDVTRDMHLMYVCGRALALLLLFADLYILILTLRLLIPKFRGKIYLFLFLLLLIPVHFYTFRPDCFKVTCFLLFFYFSIRHLQNGKPTDFAIAFFFLLAGILFKQDLLIYGLIFYGLFFLLLRKKRYFFAPLILLLLLAAMVYALYLDSGVNLYRDIFVYNIQYDTDFHLNIPLILVFSLRMSPMLVMNLLNLRSSDQLIRSLSILGLLYFLATLLSMLRMGANINYAYESSLVLLISSCLYFREHFPRPGTLLLYVCILILSFLHFLPFYISLPREKAYKSNYFSNWAAALKIQDLVKQDVVFLPDQSNYIFYSRSNLIYGYDWHYDRYCELNLNIRLKPKFAENDVVKKYDVNFSNGTVRYIVIRDEAKSYAHLRKYYPEFSWYMTIDHFLIYRFAGAEKPAHS